MPSEPIITRVPGPGFLRFPATFIYAGGEMYLSAKTGMFFRPRRVIVECPAPKHLVVEHVRNLDAEGKIVGSHYLGAQATVLTGEQSANYEISLPTYGPNDTLEVLLSNASGTNQLVLLSMYGPFGDDPRRLHG